MFRPAALLLAAGASRRMGRPKQLLPWGETTLVRHAVGQLIAVADLPVYVALGYAADQLTEHLVDLPVTPVYPADFALGLGSTLAQGAAEVHGRYPKLTHLLVALADQPAVTTGLLRELLRVSQSDAAKAIATKYERGPGVPAVFPASSLPDLLSLGGDAGAAKLLKRMTAGLRTLPPPEPLYDIDTPAEYRRFRPRA